MPQHQAERDAEQFVISSVARGVIADFGERQNVSNEITGQFLRDLMLGLRRDTESKSFPLPAGLRIRGAIIRGPIDLRDCTADGVGLPPLMLTDCCFEPDTAENCDLLDRDPVPALDLSGAHLASLSLNGSRFGLVKASSCVIDGEVDVSNVAALRPDRTSILVEACCWMDFSGCKIAGIMNARNLDLRVPNWPQTTDFDQRQPRYALFMAASTIGGTLDLSGRKVRIDGGVCLYLAKIGGDLWLGGCKLISNGGGALYAQGVCARAVFAERSPPLKAKGLISFSDARIEHGISLPGAIISAEINDEGGGLESALRANGLETGGDVLLRKLNCKGSVRFDRARIGGSFSLQGARLNGAGRDALHAPGMIVKGGLLLGFGKAPQHDKSRGFRADGCLWLYGASIGEHIDLRGASLTGSRPDSDPGGVDSQYVNAISGTDLTVGDSIFIGSESKNLEFKAVGAVRFQRARIAKHLEIVRAEITTSSITEGGSSNGAAPKDTVLDLGWTRIEGSLKLENNTIHGSINLSYTYAAILSDKLDGYPPSFSEQSFGLELEGFEYLTLQSPALLSSEAMSSANHPDEIAETRSAWLIRGGSKPHSYAVLARALQRQALPDAARQILVRQQDQELEHRRLGWSKVIRHPGRAVTNIFMRSFGFAFGYGFCPKKATRTLIGAWFLGALFFYFADYRGAMVIDQQPVTVAIGRQKPVTIELSDKQTQMLGGRVASDIPCRGNMNAVVYALDVFIPLVDLREESKCDMGQASGAELIWGEETTYRVLKTFYALLGWLIISLSILTYTGFIERRRVAGS